MAVRHEDAELSPAEILEQLILTRNFISDNVACSFDSWVQSKMRRSVKSASKREVRTVTLVANRNTGRVRSIAKESPKLKPSDVVIGEVDLVISNKSQDLKGFDAVAFYGTMLDVDVFLTSQDGTTGHRSSTLTHLNSGLTRMLIRDNCFNEAVMDSSNHSTISNCIDAAAQAWLKKRKR